MRAFKRLKVALVFTFPGSFAQLLGKCLFGYGSDEYAGNYKNTRGTVFSHKKELND